MGKSGATQEEHTMSTTPNPADERMHPTGDAAGWSESYYFNFVDPDSNIAMFTRMGFRPGNGWADALHVVYLGGERVAFTYGRRDIGADLTAYDGDLAVGNLRLTCLAPFDHWRIGYDGPAQDIADAAVLLQRRKLRGDHWYRPAQLRMQVDFLGTSPPHYAAAGERGHFEHTGRVSGRIQLDEQSFDVAGYGVRDKSWGPRDWGAGGGDSGAGGPDGGREPHPFVNWFSMNFGADTAMGGACLRQPDGAMRGTGWLWRDGQLQDLDEVTIDTRYRPDSILHTSLQLRAHSTSGDTLNVTGRVLTVCPTKIPMPGGATFVNEGLAEFTLDGMTGYGIAEHWHALRAPG